MRVPAKQGSPHRPVTACQKGTSTCAHRRMPMVVKAAELPRPTSRVKPGWPRWFRWRRFCPSRASFLPRHRSPPLSRPRRRSKNRERSTHRLPRDMPQPMLSGGELRLDKPEDVEGASSACTPRAATLVCDSSRPPTGSLDGGASTALRGQDFPEGGWAGWSTVAGAFLIQICGFGYTGSFGAYQDFYTRVYLSNHSSSAIAWIGSINGLLCMASGLLSGRLYDRGYFYYVLYGGSLLLAFSLFMLSLAKPGQYYQILLSQGIGVGLGGGILYVPSVAIISQYFQKQRALAMTLVACGSSLGSVVHPIMLNNMLNDPRFGFAIGARANAGLITGLLLIACALMRTRTNEVRESANLWVSARRFTKDGPYVFAVLGMTTFAVGLYYPFFYVQLDALKHGLPKSFSFYSLVILNSSGFLGRLLPGFVANKLGVANMAVVATFVCSVVIFGTIGLGSIASVVVISVLYGFFAGTYIAMLPPLLTQLTDDMSELGARMGIAFGFCGLGTLIGSPIEGALLTRSYVWWRPAVFSGIMAFVGCASFALSLILLRRRKVLEREALRRASPSRAEKSGVGESGP